jgi:hypothetical protein
VYVYIHIYVHIYIIRFWKINEKNVTYQDAILGARAKLQPFLCVGWIGNNAVVGDDNDDVYLRLQHGRGFHNLVYMSYVKHINPASKA